MCVLREACLEVRSPCSEVVLSFHFKYVLENEFRSSGLAVGTFTL